MPQSDTHVLVGGAAAVLPGGSRRRVRSAPHGRAEHPAYQPTLQVAGRRGRRRQRGRFWSGVVHPTRSTLVARRSVRIDLLEGRSVRPAWPRRRRRTARPRPRGPRRWPAAGRSPRRRRRPGVRRPRPSRRARPSMVKVTRSELTSGSACASAVHPSQVRNTSAEHDRADDHGPPPRAATGRRTARRGCRAGTCLHRPIDAQPHRLAGMPDQPRAGYRLMHVHAHPDDESSKGAASTAKYVAEGVDVHVATCTGGERGSILNPKMDRPDILANITEVRRQEMERARDILGVRQDWLGFVDSGWPEGDPKPPLPGRLLRDHPGGGGGRAAGPADAGVPAARRHDVRRARRLPAPRPHHVPQGLGGGVRGGRRPGAVPRRWASPGSR